MNARYERTESGFGTLTSLWILGGIRAQIFPFWEIAGSASLRQADGTEVGLAGNTLARYPYLYDNTDLAGDRRLRQHRDMQPLGDGT